jgi:hypothetical protein
VTVLQLADYANAKVDQAPGDLAALGVSVSDLSVAELSRFARVLVQIRNPGPALPILED